MNPDATHGTTEGNDNNFIEFYRSCLEDDNEITHHPRMTSSYIDSFDYYTPDKFNSKIQLSETNDLAILNINIRGIARNYDNFLLYLNCFKASFDVLILNECHIQESLISKKTLENMYPITGYNMYFIDSKIKYGGIIIYVKEKFDSSIVPEFSQSNNICDSLFLKINNCSTRKKLYVGGFYRYCKSNSSDVMNFLSILDEHLGNLNKTKNDIVIAGDFNICLLKSTYKHDSLAFLNTTPKWSRAPYSETKPN